MTLFYVIKKKKNKREETYSWKQIEEVRPQHL